jgi:CRISPR-associated protein (TIGR03984 family)
MKRAIKECRAVLRPVQVELQPSREWLQQQAREHGLKYLLAHADDGVIWGRLDGEVLRIARDAAGQHADALACSPPLRVETLQQARLFGELAELLVWREDAGWKARLIRDEATEQITWKEAIDEYQLLWGTHGTALEMDFTLFRDGAQGLRHAVPVVLAIGAADVKAAPPRLLVRHYLADEDFARIVASRLVDLEPDKEDRS